MNNRKLVRLIISGVLLFASLMMCILGIGCSIASKLGETFVEVPAYITDVRETTIRSMKSSRTQYEYTVHYTYDGQEYEEREKSDFRPDEDISSMYYSPETGMITETSAETFKYSTYVFFVLAAGLLIASIIAFIVIKV
ncbi:DUF3592 domain-containing protein [Butyrivibrio sp. WCD2001]|uniref:DUF3592 domain-containing protein n=1 Tax=Butyrivibrio sp. WCD2001 TaxID=1280681 RepID=UPI0003FC9F1D|nr:DUF3592 domain-containing protein [Butyrivibrio sp. WCD2001]